MPYITFLVLQSILSRNTIFLASLTLLLLVSCICLHMAHDLPHFCVPDFPVFSNIFLCFPCAKMSCKVASRRYAAMGGCVNTFLGRSDFLSMFCCWCSTAGMCGRYWLYVSIRGTLSGCFLFFLYCSSDGLSKLSTLSSVFSTPSLLYPQFCICRRIICLPSMYACSVVATQKLT